MNFTIDFDMNNDAFLLAPSFDSHAEDVRDATEVAAILRRLADMLDDAAVLTDQNGGTLRDSNGNSVGSWGVSAWS